ncbi:MAG: molybdopterin dinucleotide binding domain-containing protein [Candidatus Thorarchaeota archaeon]
MALGDLLFPNIEMKLVISHAFHADVESVKDKLSEEYKDAAAQVQLSKADMQKLGLKPDSTVSIQSKTGNVVVHAILSEKGKNGIAVMTRGPWALALVATPRDGNPPQYHGIPVTITRSSEKVTPLLDLLQDS